MLRFGCTKRTWHFDAKVERDFNSGHFAHCPYLIEIYFDLRLEESCFDKLLTISRMGSNMKIPQMAIIMIALRKLFVQNCGSPKEVAIIIAENHNFAFAFFTTSAAYILRDAQVVLISTISSYEWVGAALTVDLEIAK